jgi:hypothetical protein
LLKTRENEYFVPAIYAIQGASLLILLFFAFADKPPAFTASLGNSAARVVRKLFLPAARGGRAVDYPSRPAQFAADCVRYRRSSGILAGFWFGVIVFNFLVNSVVRHDADVGAASVLALFFLPLFFTFPFAVKDCWRRKMAPRF